MGIGGRRPAHESDLRVLQAFPAVGLLPWKFSAEERQRAVRWAVSVGQ